MNPTGQTPSTDSTQFPANISFPDRRTTEPDVTPVIERRQFANTHSELSAEARRLGQAIDQYKLVHRRRFITYEEMLSVIKSLGYQLEN